MSDHTLDRAVRRGNDLVWIPTKIATSCGRCYDPLGFAATEVSMMTPGIDALLHFILCESTEAQTQATLNIFLAKVGIARATLVNNPPPPVIMVTLRGLEESARQCIQAGLHAWYTINVPTIVN